MRRFITQLCYIAGFLNIAFCGPDVFFFHDKPPSYNIVKNPLRRNTGQPKSIDTIIVLIYGNNFETRKSDYNKTLNTLSNEWKICSGGKSNDFNVTFQNVVSFESGCNPIINNFNKSQNINYIQLLSPEQCIPEDSSSIGHGFVDFPLAVIYASPYTYSMRLAAHELGHNMGLFHAARYNDEYGDPTCAMGFVGGGLKDRKACFNAPHMNALGWTVPEEIKNTGKIVLRTDPTYTYTIDGNFYFQFILDELYIYKSYAKGEKNWDTELLQVLGPGVQLYNFASFQLFLNYDTVPATAEIVDLGTYPQQKTYNYLLLSAAGILFFLLLFFIFI